MTVIVNEANIRIEKLQLGPYGTNAYIIICPATGDSVLVDAPAEGNTILDKLKRTKPGYILLTHNHLDHTGALAELRSRLNVPLAAHVLDAVNLPSKVDIILNDGDTVKVGNISLKVLHTPGHTPGSLCFSWNRHLLSGDTLFPGGPGKTRTPGDFRQIVGSITSKIFVLPDDTGVYPGHGDTTVLKKAKEEFAAFSSRPHSPELCGDVLWLSS